MGNSIEAQTAIMGNSIEAQTAIMGNSHDKAAIAAFDGRTGFTEPSEHEDETPSPSSLQSLTTSSLASPNSAQSTGSSLLIPESCTQLRPEPLSHPMIGADNSVNIHLPVTESSKSRSSGISVHSASPQHGQKTSIAVPDPSAEHHHFLKLALQGIAIVALAAVAYRTEPSDSSLFGGIQLSAHFLMKDDGGDGLLLSLLAGCAAGICNI
jgi:hypothetical protein